MIIDQSWLDPASVWWAKANRALARAAFRSVQPFRIREEAILHGVQVTDTYEQEYHWSELYRLTQLSNLDKHRRLTLMAWWPDLIYWMSNGPSKPAGSLAACSG